MMMMKDQEPSQRSLAQGPDQGTVRKGRLRETPKQVGELPNFEQNIGIIVKIGRPRSMACFNHFGLGLRHLHWIYCVKSGRKPTARSREEGKKKGK